MSGITLRPYQEVGAAWLASRIYGLLADHPGLGKSAQAITACRQVGAQRILVICPAIARENWLNELTQCWGSEIASGFIMVSERCKPAPSRIGYIISYNLMTEPAISTYLRSQRWDVVIADESHYLKGVDEDGSSVRSRAVLGKRGVGIIHSTDRLWFLSGTPTPNHAGELWPILYTCRITSYTFEQFIDRYCRTAPFNIPGRYGVPRTRIVGNKRETAAELRSLVAPFTLRRRKQDVLKDLPPIEYCEVVVPESPVELDRWFEQSLFPGGEALVRTEFSRQEFAVTAALDVCKSHAAKMQALGALDNRDASSTFRRLTALKKTPAIAELIAEELTLKHYPKIVLFAWHRDPMCDLQERLSKFGAAVVYGGTPPEKKSKYLREFRTHPRRQVLICQIRAAGIAINLDVADEVGMVESSWVDDDNVQAIMRCHRMNSTYARLRVRFFALANSVDQLVQRTCRRKMKDNKELWDTEGAEEELSDRVQELFE